MKNLNLKCFAWVIFGLFAASFTGVAFVRGRTIENPWTLLVTGYQAIPILLLMIAGFVSFAWKWPFFRGWLVPFPDLTGTWVGTIQTTWVNPETGQIPPPIPTMLKIKQSFIKVSCLMQTGEMASRSFIAGFWIDGEDQIRKLAYNYTSKPSVTVEDRSRQHDGTIVFDLIGDPETELHGEYWTSRKTTGRIELRYWCKDLLDKLPPEIGIHPLSLK